MLLLPCVGAELFDTQPLHSLTAPAVNPLFLTTKDTKVACAMKITWLHWHS